jgi:hypothetical protein
MLRAGTNADTIERSLKGIASDCKFSNPTGPVAGA